MSKNIILIGFMGSGKTSVGEELAKVLSYTFCDTDQLIEQEAGITIKEMFQTHGEEYFRSFETRLLQKLESSLSNSVLSTGGGLPLKDENAKLLKEIGHVIYLQTSKDTVLQRLMGDTNRPLLQGEDRNERVEQLLTSRTPLYEKAANQIVITDGKNVEEIVETIIKQYKEL